MSLREWSSNYDIFLSLKVSMTTNKYIATKRSAVSDIANPLAPIAFHGRCFAETLDRRVKMGQQDYARISTGFESSSVHLWKFNTLYQILIFCDVCKVLCSNIFELFVVIQFRLSPLDNKRPH